jgi:hypothetical protein
MLPSQLSVPGIQYFRFVSLGIFLVKKDHSQEYGTTIKVDLMRRVVPCAVNTTDELNRAGFEAIKDIIVSDFPRPIWSANRPPLDS